MATLVIEVSSDMIKPFSGDGEFVPWFKKVKLIAKLKKITDEACFLSLYLEGDALSWYLEMRDMDQKYVGKIEAGLKSAFMEGPFVAYHRLGSLAWDGEQVNVFANEIRRLAGLAGFTGDGLDRIIKSTFVNGFPDQISMGLQQVPNFESIPMSDLVIMARILASKKPSKLMGLAAKYPGGGVQKWVTQNEESSVDRVTFKGRCYMFNG